MPADFHYPLLEDYVLSQSTTNKTNHTVNLPSCLPGELLVCMIDIDGNAITTTFPTGSPDSDEWTQLLDGESTDGNTLQTLGLAIKPAVVDDNLGSITVVSSSSLQAQFFVFAVSGWGSYLTPETQGINNSFDHALPDLSIPTTDHYLLVVGDSFDDNRGGGYPGEYTDNRHNFQIGGSGNFGLSILFATQFAVRQAGDVESPGQFTLVTTTESGQTFTWGIRPDSGAGPSEIDMTIQNPGFEDGVATAWIATTGALGNRGSNPAPHSGSNYAMGGTVALTIAHQDIPIPSGLHAAVDAGQVRTRVEWWQNSFAGADDGVVNLYWLDDASPENILGNVQTVAESAPTTWTQRSIVHAAPAGARALRIELECRRDSGTNNDAYFDDFSGVWRVFS